MPPPRRSASSGRRGHRQHRPSPCGRGRSAPGLGCGAPALLTRQPCRIHPSDSSVCKKVRYLPPLKRAVKRAFKEDDVPDAAAAIAYYGFLAIPSLLLVAVGFFGLWAGPDTIKRVVDKLGEVVPGEAVTLVQTTLTNVTENRSGGLVMVIVGFALAAWTVSGAMGAVMRALNRVHRRTEGRGFVVQRGTGLVMVVLALIANAL